MINGILVHHLNLNGAIIYIQITKYDVVTKKNIIYSIHHSMYR